MGGGGAQGLSIVRLLIQRLPLLAVTLLSARSELITVPSDGADASSPAAVNLTVLPGAGGTDTAFNHTAVADGYLSIVSNGAPHFKAPPPAGGDPCGRRTRTSITALENDCHFATNGSPFNMATGDCDCGLSITDGQPYGSGGYGVGFGSTAQGDWVVGTPDDDAVTNLNVTEFVVGFSWLVRDGVNVANAGDFVAPRTTVGLTAEGKLLSLTVDGCEPTTACQFLLGKTETQMADLLISVGAVHAVNLDGGGSSAVVVDGQVVDHPTDTDLWARKKERAVTTIVCTAQS